MSNIKRKYSELPEVGFMRLSQVLHFVPVGRSTWWSWVASGKAPASIKIGPKTTVWKAQDIHQFLNTLSKGGVK